MPDEHKDFSHSSILRHRAEELLRQRPYVEGLPRTDMLELIHELEVHQTELEIQNEELRRAQEEISALHREYEDLYEFAPCGYLTLTPEGVITRCNLTGVKLLGVERTRLKRAVFSRFIVPEWRDDYWKALKRAGEGGEKQSIELKLIDKDNNAFWVLADIQANLVEAGDVCQWRLVLLDITERKKHEDEIRLSNEWLQQREKEIESFLRIANKALENAAFETTARLLFNECKAFTGATAGYVALLSESGEENKVLFLDSGVGECTVDHSLPMPVRGLREQAYLSGRAVYENDFDGSGWKRYLPAGHVKMQNVMFAPLRVEGKTLGVIGLANKNEAFTANDARIASAFGDLAALALMNSRGVDALKESELRYRLLFQNLTPGFALHEIILDECGRPSDYRFLQVNPAFEQLTGLRAEELIGRTVLEAIPGIEHFWIETYGKVALTGEAINFESFSQSLGKHYDVTAYSPEPRRFATIFVDITDRKLAEAELRSSEERFRLLVENAPEAIYVHTDGILRFANAAALRLYGAGSVEQLLGSPVVNRIHPNYRAKAMERIHLLCSERRVVPVMEQKHIKLDGTIIEVEVSAVPLSVDAASGALVFVRDITERTRVEEEKRNLETQLRHAQKLEAIGALAGGIAHDFNNILSPIIGYTEMALDDIPESAPSRSDLGQVLTAASRAKDLIKQILSFSHLGEEKELKPLDLSLIVKEVMKLLYASLPSSIGIKQSIHKATVLADAGQIHQVIVNLCTNAAHAMGEKGTLEVSLEEVSLSFQDIAALAYVGIEPGLYARLSVKDTGHGMDADTMGRIFEPYYTTKEVDKGTGLGLAVVHGIVKRHGGEIRVQSELGKGSVFDVFLPLVEIEAGCESCDSQVLPGGSERILLVDDEPAITKMGARMLEKLGYRVTAKNSPKEALDLFRSHPDQFDLIITDYTMPQMVGTELARRCMMVRAGIPIIILTGHDDRLRRDVSEEPGAKAAAMKPLDRRQLARLVRDVLNEAMAI